MIPGLTVVILTRDEEVHIARALESVAGVAGRVVVVDSGSRDATCEIARAHGAQVLGNPWRSHATQFNWALANLPPGTEWVLRLDADETLDATLRDEIVRRLPGLSPDVHGVEVGRVMAFLGRPIRHGGLFPMVSLRLVRAGLGQCEDRWMDEHLIVSGRTERFAGTLLDDNRGGLTRWTAKHNAYASREVADILLRRAGAAGRPGGAAGRTRRLKEGLYGRMPLGLRPALYFLYRYVARLGFLDGLPGFAFHALQGFWYRLLVDLKLAEVQAHMRATGAAAPRAIADVLGLELGDPRVGPAGHVGPQDPAAPPPGQAV